MNLLHGVAIISLGVSLAVADTVGGYSFTVDGESVDPGLYTTEGAEPVPGDVVVIGGIPLLLDEPGKYDFQIRDGKVMRVLEGGRMVMVACSVAAPPDDSEAGRLKSRSKMVNPLETMSDEELRALRGISLNAWPEGIEKQLERLDLKRVSFLIQSGAISREKAAIPALPKGIGTLIIELGSGQESGFLGGLRDFKQLRFLDVSRVMVDEVDLAVLQGLPLVYLGAPWAKEVKNVETLASLKQLKCLSANYCSYLGNGRWLSELPDLRKLYAGHVSGPEDRPAVPLELSVLSTLPKLVAFHVQGSPVSSLPTVHMPSLKQATLLLSGATPASIDALVAANPQMKVSRSMNAELASRLATADRMVARSGGVCHRRPEQEKQIAEVRDAGEIAEVSRHFEVLDSASGGHCMCCGDPSFEFYKDGKQIALIGFHHGRSIRWADGIWPGDGVLTSASGDYLVEWLAQHGYSGPKDDVMERRLQEAAYLRRSQRYQALLPLELYSALNEAQTLDEATATWTRLVPDVTQRAVLFLRLFGCDDGTWTLYTNWDQALQETWIPSIPEATLHSVIAAAPDRTEEAQGAARWLFGDDHVSKWASEPEVVKRLALFALTHPRQANRWRMLAVLRDEGSARSLEILREVMQRGSQPRKLAADEQNEPGGNMTFYPGAIALPSETTDTVAAALCLVALKDKDSEQEVERLKKSFDEAMRKVWEEAMADMKK